MLNPSSPLARLFATPMRPGTVQWLGIHPARHAPLIAAEHLHLDPAHGVPGDHYAGRSGTRQVTLIGEEQLRAIASFLGRDHVTPEELRRNVVVRGLNLHALRGSRLRLGTAVLDVTGDCHPCSRMEQILGKGGYNAVRGHGGVAARVVAAGAVRVADDAARMD